MFSRARGAPRRMASSKDEPDGLTAEERWRSLIALYGGYLRRVIARLCPRNLGLQFDDIEQEARLRLLKALRDEREIIDPASYLYRIAATATIDAVRRARARREEPFASEGDGEGEGGADRLADSRPCLEQATQCRILVQRVQEVVAGFSPERRRVLALHLQGFTSQEIADLHGWTEPKARNLVYRALRELREALRDQGIAYGD
jgi:RNA polymerase sigma factor (sigma-70 family)